MNEEVLTKKEIGILKQKIVPSFSSTLLFVITLLAVFIFLLFIPFITEDENIKKLNLQFKAPITLVMLYILIYLVKSIKYIKDIIGRKKLILGYSVDAKFKEKRGHYQYTGMSPDLNFYYYILFNKKKAAITKEQYKKINVGDRILVHIAPKSKVVLKVE